MLEKGLFKSSVGGLGRLGVAVAGLTAMAYTGLLKDEHPENTA